MLVSDQVVFMKCQKNKVSFSQTISKKIQLGTFTPSYPSSKEHHVYAITECHLSVQPDAISFRSSVLSITFNIILLFD